MFILGPVQQQRQGSGLALLLSSWSSPLGHIMAAGAPSITTSASKGSEQMAVSYLTSSLKWEEQHSQSTLLHSLADSRSHLTWAKTGPVPTPSFGSGPSSLRSRALH